MLSLTKIALVAAVAFGLAAFARRMRGHKARQAARRAQPRPQVAELVRCPACGVHHAAGDDHVCEAPTRRKS